MIIIMIDTPVLIGYIQWYVYDCARHAREGVTNDIREDDRQRRSRVESQ